MNANVFKGTLKNSRCQGPLEIKSTRMTPPLSVLSDVHLKSVKSWVLSLWGPCTKALCVELAERGSQPSIIRPICVHSLSFAAKKKISE